MGTLTRGYFNQKPSVVLYLQVQSTTITWWKHLQGAWDLIRKTIWWMTSRDVELR